MANAINYVGIARKAGEITIGEVNCGSAIRSGRAKLLIVAKDASANALSRAENYVSGGKTIMIVAPFTKLEISEITGVNGCSMAAFTDVGLASAFLDSLSEDYPEFTEQAKQLSEKKDKAMRRKQEAVAHENNKKFGKTAHPDQTETRRK